MEKSSKKADKNRFLDYALRAPLEMTVVSALHAPLERTELAALRDKAFRLPQGGHIQPRRGQGEDYFVPK